MRFEALACTKILGAVTLILLWSSYSGSAQEGFLSLDCGGVGNHTDPTTGITWVSDDNYIQGGRQGALNETLDFYFKSFRVFPKPLKKTCYRLPIIPNVPFLLRLFFVGADDGNTSSNFTFSIETQDMLYKFRNAIPQSRPPMPTENILMSGGEVLYVCLIRVSEDFDPFISSIELRPFRNEMYDPVKPGLMLHYKMRYSFGASQLIRYPSDPYDRFWKPGGTDVGENINSTVPISIDHAPDRPPPIVMESASTMPAGTRTNYNSFEVDLLPPTSDTLLLLYFAEIQEVNASDTRIFSVTVDGVSELETVQIHRNFFATELRLLNNRSISAVTLTTATGSTRGPILNGLEWYQRILTSPITSWRDVQALATIKKCFQVSTWISDPCFAIPWKGIKCNNDSETVKVIEIKLSGSNLTGSIPASLAKMTALVNISLDNNNLTGSLPNLTNLIDLQRLHLQNNRLNGEFPNWLSQLPKLKELFIENNNFSGVIPQRILDNHSLFVRYTGNHYLCMKKSDCQPSSNGTSPLHSKGHNMKMIAGVTAGGFAIIGLLLLLGIIVYRNKFRRKEIVNSDTKGSTSGNRESIYVHGDDFSMVFVPNSTKTRSFTLDEMRTATENFIHKIGEGGFGSVFHGKLEEGKQIAVKVLSSFSKQGAQEFLNEIDLLSRVHHKNLVSLLGYCNESRELMLAYEYMPGGSLKDHLYGTDAGDNDNLDWNTRLKIALDSACGLEYLHVGCTPKIIHRDVKTANILLDANLNGKLADFGLSRVTIDGQASHVTTNVKGTAGYLDPEYFSTQMLTEKSDVYSFGVVLLEIICGRRPIDSRLSEEEVNLIRWVTPYVKTDGDPTNISRIVDNRLQSNDYDINTVIHLAKLAIKCSEADPSNRPTVSEIVAEIKVAIKYENDKNSGIKDNISELSGDYSDLINSQISMSDSSGPKGVTSSENSSNFARKEDKPNPRYI